jgi:nucleoporin NUP159
MAFSFGASGPAGGNIPAELGPELPDVYAEVCRASMLVTL